MKILYVGTERDEAQAIATAVNGLSEGIRVSWTSGLDQVAKWIDESDGVRALVVEAHPNGPPWRPVLTYAAGLPTALPVVVIVPEGPASHVLALDAHECIARNPSLLRDLPAVITRAIDRARQRQPSQQTSSLPQLVTVTDRTVADAERELLPTASGGVRDQGQRLEKLESLVALERAARADLALKLVQATATIQETEHRHQSAMAEAAQRMAKSQSQYELGMAQAAAARDTVDKQFSEAAIEVERVRRNHASAVADVERLSRREAELSTLLDAATTTRSVLERRLADAETALSAGEARAAKEQRTVAEQFAERQQDFQRQISEHIDKRRTVEETLAHALSAADAARQRHESAMSAAAAQSRELQAALSAARQELESNAAHLDALTVREAEHTLMLAAATTSRETIERRLAATEAALQEAEARATRELLATGKQAAEREAELEVQIRQERAARTALEEEIAAAGVALEQTRREHRSAAADVARLTEREVCLTSELTDGQTVLRDERQRHVAEHEAAAACQADLEARMSRADEKIAVLQQTLAETRSAALDAERRLTEDANALRATALVQAAEFDRQFDEQRRHYEGRLTTRENDIEQLGLSLTACLEELEVTKRQREVLQAEADQLPGLRQELHQSRVDNHRLFHYAPLPMFRCTKDGVLTQANRMMALLVGGCSPDELRGADFAAAVFESPNDLSWLIERCQGSGEKGSTQTTWQRKDGSRLLVRLSACATSSDLIECGVEDLTPVRVLQDRLTQAHRMEAVGRLAAEVAVTCGNLLRGMQENAQQWLMSDPSHTTARQRGEMLLEELSRAAALLRQLAAYGDEESRRPAVVELSTVVRDLGPVLKRVAGDAVDVQLPAASPPLNVDAGAERVQRLLVNLAANGRARMPFGGRLKIELGMTVVDRHFTAKHPHVRLGRHALVTVTESRRPTPTEGFLQLHADEDRPGSQANAPVQTRVDLGILQELVGECGGHLWMTVQPLGDMVVKIRLPLLSPYGQPPRPAMNPGGDARTIAHWSGTDSPKPAGWK